MKSVTKLFLLAFIILLGVGWTTAWSAPVPKIEICHIPPDDPENFHSINVSENALGAHLAHGDLVGACNAVCADLCDDGNACTIDDTGDCETNGCPADPAPVDCSDGDLCTTDSCDPGSGCMVTPVVCDDGDLCTVDMCNPSDGSCVAPPVSCDDGYTCNPANGICEEDGPGPDPECAGQTCSTFTTCNAGGSCGSSGVCGSTAEGGGLCVDGSTQCSGLSACSASTDCAGGEICFVDSCCGAGVCVPSSQFCSDPAAPVQESGALRESVEGTFGG